MRYIVAIYNILFHIKLYCYNTLNLYFITNFVDVIEVSNWVAGKFGKLALFFFINFLSLTHIYPFFFSSHYFSLTHTSSFFFHLNFPLSLTASIFLFFLISNLTITYAKLFFFFFFSIFVSLFVSPNSISFFFFFK